MRNAQMINTYSTVLAAMGNARRLTILALVAGDEMSVGELADKVGISQSALSQHLARLRAVGLVSSRRDGQTIFYRSSGTQLQPMLADLSRLLGAAVPRIDWTSVVCAETSADDQTAPGTKILLQESA